MKNNRLIHILLVLITLLSIQNSCITRNTSDSIRSSIIFEDLQKRVPFDIVVPEYLPDNVSPVPAGIGYPYYNSITDSVSVRFAYSSRENNTQLIEILEENTPIIAHSAEGTSSYIVIKGISVFEEPTDRRVYENSTTIVVPGFYYNWNMGEMNYQLRVYGYEQSECIKIIESMIK